MSDDDLHPRHPADDGPLMTRRPLQISKVMADRRANEVQATLAAPADGGFAGSALPGDPARARADAGKDAGDGSREAAP